MLTEGDDRADGRKTSYLEKAHQWRAHDPELFDGLRCSVVEQDARRVSEAETFLAAARFHADLVPVDPARRAAWLERMIGRLADVDLVFFDPDNSLEVKSCPPRLRWPPKHLYWSELRATYDSGPSLLVFQHFPHEAHGPYVARRLAEMGAHTGAAVTDVLVTAEVVFLLAAQGRHVEALQRGTEEVSRQWRGRIDIRLPFVPA